MQCDVVRLRFLDNRLGKRDCVHSLPASFRGKSFPVQSSLTVQSNSPFQSNCPVQSSPCLYYGRLQSISGHLSKSGCQVCFEYS